MSKEKSKVIRFLTATIKVIIPVILIGAAIAVGAYLLNTKPVATKKPAQAAVTRVNVLAAQKRDNPINVRAMGNVISSTEANIAAQVSGEVVYVAEAFVPGGKFAKDDIILEIDKRDYELLVRQKEQEIEQAKAKLRLEQGRQAVAKAEFELLGESITEEDEEFVLRKPQLLQAQAEVERLQTQLDQAKIDLERATVRAPFNAVVENRYVNLGSSVNAGGLLVSLFGTDVYWVELSMPVDELQWIRLPSANQTEGSKARVFMPGSGGRFKDGYVFKLSSQLETEGRMARVLVSINDPLAVDGEDSAAAPLLVGSFVDVEIIGIELENSVKIPRQALRDNNYIWLNEDGKLAKRQIEPVYKDDKYVYTTSGIADNEQIIISDIALAIDGIKLTVEETISNE
jgi:RND family efflux transporter MFP subunit